MACAQKWPWPDRESGIDQCADSTDFFFRQRRRSVAESDNRSHPGDAQHRNPPCRILESGEHVTRKQRRIQNFDAVRPDALVFVSRKESFDLVESFQPLEDSNFMLRLDCQSIPGCPSPCMSREYQTELRARSISSSLCSLNRRICRLSRIEPSWRHDQGTRRPLRRGCSGGVRRSFARLPGGTHLVRPGSDRVAGTP